MNQNDFPYNLLATVLPEYEGITRSDLEVWLGHLSERERDVVLKKYREGMTLEDIGKEYNVTRERIRQVLAKAEAKLQIPGYAACVKTVKYSDYLELQRKTREETAEVMRKYKELRSYVQKLHNAIAAEFPQHSAVFSLMSDKILGDIAMDIPDMPLEQLDLGVRAFNCLKRAGINTAREAEALGPEDILKVRNLGKNSAQEVKDKLLAAGYDPKF